MKLVENTCHPAPITNTRVGLEVVVDANFGNFTNWTAARLDIHFIIVRKIDDVKTPLLCYHRMESKTIFSLSL